MTQGAPFKIAWREVCHAIMKEGDTLGGFRVYPVTRNVVEVTALNHHLLRQQAWPIRPSVDGLYRDGTVHKQCFAK